MYYRDSLIRKFDLNAAELKLRDEALAIGHRVAVVNEGTIVSVSELKSGSFQD